LWLLLVLLVGLATAYLLFWIYVRRRRRKAQEAGSEVQPAKAAPSPSAAP
jgi:hypothetical protein